MTTCPLSSWSHCIIEQVDVPVLLCSNEGVIRYLRGKIIDKVRNQLIIDINGVGYNAFVSASTVAQTQIGATVPFHIAESIREDGHDLYGFLTTDERDTFETLRKVSGVGPKAALAIISFYAPEILRSVIGQSDTAKLSFVPGIGPKLAGKIIVELKGRLDSTDLLAKDGADTETIAALEALGYNRSEIAAILPKIPSSITGTQDRITWVLRQVSG